MHKLLLALFIATLFFLILYANQRNQLLTHLNLIISQEREIYAKNEANLRQELELLKAKLAKIESVKINPQVTPAATLKVDQVEEPQPTKISRPEWKAKVSLRKVEERLALTASERAELEEKLKNGEKLTVLSDVVGVDRAKRFFEEEEEARKAEEEEVIKEKLFKLSRVLSLNPEQETKTAQVLRNSREVLRNSYLALKQQEERAMELHSEPSSGDELRAVYERYRVELEQINSKENAILSKELKSILTEEQLNKLLEYQATERVGLR